MAALLTLGGFGVTANDVQPSALRVAVTATVGLLAPLFWPGSAATPTLTALRIASWSIAGAGLAAMLLGTIGNPMQQYSRILVSCAMLWLILLVAHTVVALLEGRLRNAIGSAQSAREPASFTVAFALALLGAAPIWLGPAAELLSGDRAWVIDTVIGISPLTHLAVASDNDLLRNQWFYQHSNLAALQFSYPGPAALALSYATVCLVLALFALAFRRPLRRTASEALTHTTMENTK